MGEVSRECGAEGAGRSEADTRPPPESPCRDFATGVQRLHLVTGITSTLAKSAVQSCQGPATDRHAWRHAMTRYYVNKNAQDNGDHEVHADGCNWLPKPENRIFLGDYPACSPAVTQARRTYPQSNGCIHCSKACHTG
jgi:hypothetical protein